ncbi:MAG: hypothetical protein A3H96_17940 [Acidobacteria bacterium RIFCSPLOWO2_02_FULL_67_36]|nr:MAG: hypothetical protein A3H96_17940 [Acidobacteria bacterium RIFCSPLOWO2_02_FULL_67_36]OFW23848.1 MAG: hypothetical protein A3G21_02875 [Acidobacteria bacterium RIFCSPLOWO2_12_FULL_66_21]
MKAAVLLVDTGTGPRRVRLADYLDGPREEQATRAAHDWIKRLRHVKVEEQPLRRRFRYRGDSLWWFAELYLHKRQVILDLFRILLALEHLFDCERPLEIKVASGGPLVRGMVPQVAGRRRCRHARAHGFGASWLRLARLDLRARALTFAARASRHRPGTAASGPAGVRIVAFVHRAFWRAGASEASAEFYIGSVLAALGRRLSSAGVCFVGVGPRSNFGARRWWHAMGSDPAAAAVIPVERFAPGRALKDSTKIWCERYAVTRALWHSADVREHAVLNGCDCWPAIREELAGIALLQWPWSTRAMDEAGAALDALEPEAVVTYAEAGGWGRAVVLEARRRGIPSIGLQHGFIYRHWLNYLHEPDEMEPDPERPDDRGFPHPTLTLLFDGYAADHLERRGRLPRASLAVTGSPRLDALVAAAAALSPEDIERARSGAGGQQAQPLVLFVGKYREARHVLPHLVDAVATMPGVRLAIKTHPAETPDAYARVVHGRANVRVLPASAALAPLLLGSRAVVTVNSTAALDAAVLGVPALVIGLPNNLTPFVDAGMMAGAGDPSEIAPQLGRILYDQDFRQHVERARSTFMARFGIRADGRAAERAADAVAAVLSAHGRRTGQDIGDRGQE